MIWDLGAMLNGFITSSRDACTGALGDSSLARGGEREEESYVEPGKFSSLTPLWVHHVS